MLLIYAPRNNISNISQNNDTIKYTRPNNKIVKVTFIIQIHCTQREQKYLFYYP